MKKILSWLDNNLLTILAGVLIVVIPLYPKIPLADLIEGYIVRLRLDDILVLVTAIVWAVQVVRGKARLPRNKVARSIMIYLCVALLSTLSALVITETVPLIRAHVYKLLFHFVRRIEYFSLFFITYSAVRSKKDLALFAKVAVLSLLGVVLYGVGQKYFYFPAFSTMNREFSKGVMLYLAPNTRLFSTFGGHYDLAAYLMMLLTFTFPAAWLSKRTGLKIALYTLSILAYWCLVLTTSRTSFIGYLGGITLSAWFLIKFRGFWWSAKRWLAVGFISILIMFFFSNLLERFTQVIPDRQTRETILAIQKSVNQPFVKEPVNTGSIAEIPSLIALLFKREKPVIIPPSEIPPSGISGVGSTSDVPPSPVKPTPSPEVPTDVNQDEEEYRKAQALLEGKSPVTGVYSPNAIKYGLSMGIRLDVLWPNAIEGFKRNPLLGTGYSTLVKSENHEFTYAESTDNDYLRMLGETGLLGFVTFIAIIYYVFRAGLASFTNKDYLSDVIGIGVMASVVALAINALYIDVFESSKVAYTFWFLAAMAVRSAELNSNKQAG